jgi:hypothetical protein
MNGGGLPAYGLTANPFALDTLNPLISLADEDCVSFVDGWRKLRDAEDLIRQRVAADKAVFFVVTGTSSTGRTSVAYYLVHLWAKERKIQGNQVVAERNDPGPDGGSFSPEGQLLEWAQNLLLREDAGTLGITPPTKNRLAELTESDKIVKFGLAMQDVDLDLRTPAPGGMVRHLAAILERGKGDDLVRKVRDCFKATKAIVIITVDESAATANLLVNAHKALPASEGLCIRLGPIMGADVATVVQDRWDAVRKGVNNPFNLAEIVQVFDSPRTIARTVRLLERMLDMRQRFYDGKVPWPDSPGLALTGDVMRELLEDFESTLPD